MAGTDDLVKFMKRMETQMKLNHDAVNDNISKSNEKLGREIKNEISSIKEQIREVSEETANIKAEVLKNKGDTEDKLKRMEDRLEDFAKESKKIQQQKEKEMTSLRSKK